MDRDRVLVIRVILAVIRFASVTLRPGFFFFKLVRSRTLLAVTSKLTSDIFRVFSDIRSMVGLIEKKYFFLFYDWNTERNLNYIIGGNRY